MRRDRLDNEHLQMLLAFTLAPDSNCIDVGAHKGDVLRDMVRLAPAGRHVAFEPLPDFYEELVREFPGVEVRSSALSTEEGEAAFTYVKSNPGYSGFRERTLSGPPADREAIVCAASGSMTCCPRTTSRG